MNANSLTSAASRLTCVRAIFTIAALALAACLGWAGAVAPSRKPLKPSAEAEFPALCERDQEARKDMSNWLRETSARDEHLTDRTPRFLSQRMEHRVQLVSKAYMDFLTRHPGHAAVSSLHNTFTNDMAEMLEVIRQWEDARVAVPLSPAPWNQLAHDLIHHGRAGDAFVCFEKSLDLSPREAVYFSDYATALLLYRTDAMSHYRLSETELFERVLLTYRRGLKLEPESYEHAANYAQTFYAIKPARPADGMAAWETALKLATNEAERGEALTHLARHAIHTGKLGMARLYLDLVHEPHLDAIKETLLRRLDETAKSATKSGS